jgi:hypothetical protein
MKSSGILKQRNKGILMPDDIYIQVYREFNLSIFDFTLTTASWPKPKLRMMPDEECSISKDGGTKQRSLQKKKMNNKRILKEFLKEKNWAKNFFLLLVHAF